MQRQIIGRSLNPDKPFQFPLALRLIASLPLVRDLPARMVAFGPRRVRIEGDAVSPR